MSSLTNEEKRNRILKGVASIPSKNLANHIIEGDVTKEDVCVRLKELALEGKIQEIESLLEAYDDGEWEKAQSANTPQAYLDYLKLFPYGRHSSDCQNRMDELDERMWQAVQDDLCESTLNQYKTVLPQGKHLVECNALLGDLSWLEAKKLNTIKGYEEYKALHPGEHVLDVRYAIENLLEENDWFIAEAANNSGAYQQYLQKHPTGKHAQLAQNALNSNAGRNKIIADIKANRNAYDPKTIQTMVGNKIIKWSDIVGEGLYDEEERIEIEQYESPKRLDTETPPERLVDGITEVFFWGTPESGKTCAMGAILSAAKKYGILKEYSTTKGTGSGTKYMKQLSNIFVSDGICKFPTGTPTTSIQQMVIGLRDANNKIHKMNIIDLAGELFKSLFYKLNDPRTYGTFAADKQDALERTLSYLGDKESAYGDKDTGNNKIHFFIVAYGEERKTWEDNDIYMSDFLNTTIAYLNEKKVIERNTVGVYVLVTKCDLMPCATEKRKEFAEKYVKEKMPDFYQNIIEICRNAGVQDFEIIPFSIGSVFAKKLGRFNADNTDEVLNKLIMKTPSEKGRFFKWLKS